MKMHTVTFVEASDLFTPYVMERLSTLNIGTWGDNNRSLISVDRVLSALESEDVFARRTDEDEAITKMHALPNEVTYIDMEN
jgi:hypothetical protein